MDIEEGAGVIHLLWILPLLVLIYLVAREVHVFRGSYK